MLLWRKNSEVTFSIEIKEMQEPKFRLTIREKLRSIIFNKVKRKLRFRVAFPPDSRNNPQLLDEMTAAGYSATGW
jgi:hypothetical protein